MFVLIDWIGLLYLCVVLFCFGLLGFRFGLVCCLNVVVGFDVFGVLCLACMVWVLRGVVVCCFVWGILFGVGLVVCWIVVVWIGVCFYCRCLV